MTQLGMINVHTALVDDRYIEASWQWPGHEARAVVGIIDTLDEHVRAYLIQLGWTPPPK